MRKILDDFEPELRELVEKVITHYKKPTDYLRETCWLTEYEKFKCYKDRLNELLKERDAEQVVAISNGGLWPGAMARSLGYDVKVIDVHREKNFKELRRTENAQWYFIKPENISVDGFRILDVNDTSAVIESECANGVKMGVIDFDKVKEKTRTAITDGDLEQGFTMLVANKHLLDLGVNVTDKIVISNYGTVKGVRTLDNH